MYLDEVAVGELLAGIAALVLPGDRFGCDFVGAAPPGVDAPIRFTAGSPVTLPASFGWDAEAHAYDVEGERMARLWPYLDRPNGSMVIASRRG
jgi:hypothetical protein